MNVSDLLQDSPSQHRKRPSASQQDPSPPTQSMPTSLPSASVSPQSQHQSQHAHPHTLPPQTPLPSQPPYPSQPNPAQYYSPSPFSRTDPAPVHHITPRPIPPSQIQPSSLDATPAMASLQHPSPPPPPHVNPHAPWGPPIALRQGSSPLAMSNLGPSPASLHARTSHQQQHSAQIKPAMPGSERSPIVQRAHPSGSSTPSNMATHSPSTKPLLTASGTLILDKRTADEQKARRAAQAQAQAQGSSSGHPTSNPNPTMKPREQDRDKDWEQRDRERQQEDFIHHVARERGMGPFDRERERERVLPSTHERALASSHERALASPHDRPMPSPHDRSLVSPHDRPVGHRMSSFPRQPPTQGPLPPRAPGQVQQSPPGPSQRMGMGPPHHDRMPPPPHERQPHDRDRLQPQPPYLHSHRPGPPLLPGQGQFQAHPPDWDAARERDHDMAMAREREREMARESMGVGGPPRDRDLGREKDLERDPSRDSDYGFHPDHEPPAYLRERERQQRLREGPRDPGVLPPREREMLSQREREAMTQRERDMAPQREREREMMPGRERERLSREVEREREFMSREMEGMAQRDREIHVQRERERVAGLQREGETGPGMPPRAHERDRERDRERRTHSRIPSPHGLGMNVGGVSIPPIPSGSTGPGGPGQHHPPPHPHDLARERELQLMNDRERLAWEHEREREMERRQYRERMALAERERMGMPLSEREGMALSDRDRTLLDRDRVAFERDRIPLERTRMAERDRAVLEREHVPLSDRDRAVLERERALPPEQRDRALVERERGMFERERLPGDRERLMEPHRLDMLERERMEAFERERERERLEMMERERERERETGGASGGGSTRDRERERDRDRMVVDAPIAERERERDERLVGPGADREVMERQREKERLELMERERGDITDREREHINAAHREGERMDVERDRDRERFEVLERERIELLERERVGGLDVMERERLEMVDRERFEILERERLEMLERDRLEMLERMPSAAELAKARKEREKKPFVSLGTYVWPRTPFPYYFPEWIPPPVVEEDKDKPVENTAAEAASSTSSLVPSSLPQSAPTTSPVPTELRLVVLIPPSFLPPARPSKFRLWGGGLTPPPPFPPAPSAASFSRRRVYTDDSDVIQCAVHAGLLTWSGVTRAKKEGRTVRVVLALVPTLASASGAVRGGASNSRTGMNGANVVNGNTNGHVNGTTSLPRTRTSTPLPAPPASSVPSMSSSTSDPQSSMYAGGVWASRFIGGWGEAFYGEAGAGRGENASRMTGFEEAEDDGRGCVSCGWGWGHDGSAFEVISVDVVEQNAHVAPGLGIRNRSQRLAEYAQRRIDIFGVSPNPSPPLLDVTNTRKRRKPNVDFTEVKSAGASEIALISEEARRMEAMTVSFGVTDQQKNKTGVGFKYDPLVVQCALFPHLHQTSIVGPPPCKRRKVVVGSEGQGDGDVEMDAVDDPGCGVVLESTKETYLVTRAAVEGKLLYTVSVFESDAKPSQPSARTPSTLSVDPNPKSPDTPKTSLAEPPEEKKASISDPPSGGAVTDPQKPDISPDSVGGKGKGQEGDQRIASPIPPSISQPNPTLRVFRSNLTDTSFTFEDDIITVKKADEQAKDDLGREIATDEGELKVRVLRWRWYMEA